MSGIKLKLGPGHEVIKLGGTGFNYCWHCGIVLLRNERTAKALRKECGT